MVYYTMWAIRAQNTFILNSKSNLFVFVSTVDSLVYVEYNANAYSIRICMYTLNQSFSLFVVLIFRFSVHATHIKTTDVYFHFHGFIFGIKMVVVFVNHFGEIF